MEGSGKRMSDFKFAGLDGNCIMQLRKEYHTRLGYVDPNPTPENINKAFRELEQQLKDLKDGINSILGRRLHQQSMVVELAQLLKGGKG